MQKVYLLLRNNKQSGPFTIGELMQQQLRPTDMLWIEGKSTAWTYLSELELLPQEESGFTPFPLSDTIEENAEALRKKTLQHKPAPSIPVQTVVDHHIHEQEEPTPIEFVDHRPQKSAILKELVMTAVILGVFGIGIYASKHLTFTQRAIAASNTVALESPDDHAAKITVVPNTPTAPVSTASQSGDTLNQAIRNEGKNIASTSTSRKETSSTTSASQELINEQTNVPTTAVIDPATTLPVQTLPAETTPKKEVKREETPKEKVESKKEEAPKEEATEKDEKKGFLRKLFGKKKKEKEEKAEEENDQ